MIEKKYGDLNGTIAMVELTKGLTGLGLSLAGNKDRKKMSVFVCGMHPKGSAFKDGRIQVGDEILEVSFTCFLLVSSSLISLLLDCCFLVSSSNKVSSVLGATVNRCQQSARSMDSDYQVRGHTSCYCPSEHKARDEMRERESKSYSE